MKISTVGAVMCCKCDCVCVCFRAKAVLQEVSGRVEEEVLNGRPLLLEIGGVASFSTRVVFAVVKETEGKEKLRKIAGMLSKFV